MYLIFFFFLVDCSLKTLLMEPIQLLSREVGRNHGRSNNLLNLVSPAFEQC